LGDYLKENPKGRLTDIIPILTPKFPGSKSNVGSLVKVEYQENDKTRTCTRVTYLGGETEAEPVTDLGDFFVFDGKGTVSLTASLGSIKQTDEGDVWRIEIPHETAQGTATLVLPMYLRTSTKWFSASGVKLLAAKAGFYSTFDDRSIVFQHQGDRFYLEEIHALSE
jgi:hypothetical protein